MKTNFEMIVELQTVLARLDPETFLRFWYAVADYQRHMVALGQRIELADAIVQAYAELSRMIADGIIGEDLKPVTGGKVH